MGFGDLVQNREISSNTIMKGNIDDNVSNMPILLKILTFAKFSAENFENVIVMDTEILIAKALWEIL